MSNESAHDPRTRLVREKYFSLRPKPLERWLWEQSVPQAAERVFWLHWEEGMKSQDWCSEVPVKRVAQLCCIDPSTVTRSYQLLKSLGLIRREDPGRDPNNPFQQATAITEVRIPRELLTELSRSPNRASIDRIGAPQSRPKRHNTSESPKASSEAPAPSESLPPSAAVISTPAIPRMTRQQTQAMWGRASEGERSRFFSASRDGVLTMDFDTDTRLTTEDRSHLIAQLEQLAQAKRAAPPTPIGRPVSPRTADYAKPRRLSVLELARTRKRVLELVPGHHASEVEKTEQIAETGKANQEFEADAAAQDLAADHHRRHDPGLRITPVIQAG